MRLTRRRQRQIRTRNGRELSPGERRLADWVPVYLRSTCWSVADQQGAQEVAEEEEEVGEEEVEEKKWASGHVIPPLPQFAFWFLVRLWKKWRKRGSRINETGRRRRERKSTQKHTQTESQRHTQREREKERKRRDRPVWILREIFLISNSFNFFRVCVCVCVSSGDGTGLTMGAHLQLNALFCLPRLRKIGRSHRFSGSRRHKRRFHYFIKNS